MQVHPGDDESVCDKQKPGHNAPAKQSAATGDYQHWASTQGSACLLVGAVAILLAAIVAGWEHRGVQAVVVGHAIVRACRHRLASGMQAQLGLLKTYIHLCSGLRAK